MNPANLKAVLDWLRTTDLVELDYRCGAQGFSLRTGAGAAAPAPAQFSSRFIPVCAPAVGLFQPSAPGQPRLADEGLSVKAGDTMGQVETGVGAPHAIPAPCAGRVARVFIEAGKPVQYGQPLFFLERA